MADGIITKQELIDAKVDAQTLEDIVNDGPEIQVQTRLGRLVWTLATLEQRSLLKIQEWQNAIDSIVVENGVPAMVVSDSSGVTQQEINDLGGIKYWVEKSGGYQVNNEVRLDNGTVVKSTTPNNSNNPNFDMIGWDFLKSKASQVFDESGLNQQAINDLSLTPFHFGAIADGNSHPLSERYATLTQAKDVYPHAIALTDQIDWCACQALFNFVLYQNLTYLKYKIDMSGFFTLTRGLKYKVLDGAQNSYRVIWGDFVADCRYLDIDTFAVIEVHGIGVTWEGILNINALKRADYCIYVSDGDFLDPATSAINFGIKLGRCFLNGARIFNVSFNDLSMFGSMEFYRGSNGGTRYTTSLSNVVYQSVSALEKYSLLTVAQLPKIEVGKATDIFVDYNGKVSTVIEIDRVNNTLRVSPAIKTGGLAEFLPIEVYYGGGAKTAGSNSAGILFGQFSTVLDVVGIAHHAMYPCQVNYFCSEYSAISLYSNGLVGGIKVNNAYFEGDQWQYIQRTYNYDMAGSSVIDYATGVEISKHDNIQWGRDPITGLENDAYRGLDGYKLYESGIQHHKKNLPSNFIGNAFILDFNKPFDTRSAYVYGFGINVSFATINPVYNDLFGYDTQDVIIVGDGANGSVMSAITFKVLAGYTLNGGTSDVVFNNFSAAAKFTAKLVVATKDIVVSCSTLAAGKGITAQRPTSPVLGQRYYDTTLLAAGKPIEWNGIGWVDSAGTAV